MNSIFFALDPPQEISTSFHISSSGLGSLFTIIRLGMFPGRYFTSHDRKKRGQTSRNEPHHHHHYHHQHQFLLFASQKSRLSVTRVLMMVMLRSCLNLMVNRKLHQQLAIELQVVLLHWSLMSHRTDKILLQFVRIHISIISTRQLSNSLNSKFF